MAKLFEVFGNIAIQNQDAIKAIDDTIKKANELKIALGIQVEKLEDTADGMEDVGKSADNTGNKFNSFAVLFGNSMTRVINWFGRMGKAAVTTGFEFNASIESYQKQFAVLLQDEEKAKKLVDELRELAKITPLGMEGLANNAVLLLNTGIKLENIIPTLEMIGNLSLGDQNKMNSVVRAYTQIMAKGNLLAQEMYQLGDAGVPFKLIMTEFGGEKYKDGKWWESKMSDPTYKIPFEDVQKAFMAATAEGGIWHDYMFAMMETWAGQMDRLKEEGKELLGDFTEPFFEVAKSDVMPKLVESFDRFSVFLAENKDTVTEWAKSLGNLTVEAFDGLITLFEWLIKNKDAVATAFQVIGGAITLHFAAAHPYLTAIVAAVTALRFITENPYEGDDNTYMSNEPGERFQAKTPDTSNDIAADANHIREMISLIGYSNLRYYINPYDIEQMSDEELVEWYKWQNKGAFNRAAAGFLSTYGLSMPYMDEDGYIRYVVNPKGDDKPTFELFEDWGNDNNPDYVDEHNAGISSQNEDDPFGVESYRKEYGDNWFDFWYKKNKETIAPEDLDIVLNKYGIPTLGSLPFFNNFANSVLTGSNASLGGIGMNTNTMIALLNNLVAKLDTVISYQAQGKTITLNTGALVGGMGGAMDQFFGRMYQQKTREGQG